MSRKFEILACVKEVYSGVFNHFFQLIAASWAWLLVGVSAMLWLQYILSSNGFSNLTAESLMTARPMMQPGDMAQGFIAAVIYFYATAGAAVRWHRFVLLGEYSPAGTSRTAMQALAYVLTTIKIGIVYALLVLIPVFAAGFVSSAVGQGGGAGIVTAASFLFIALIVGMIILGIRLSLALPDVALGGRGRLKDAFQRTKGFTLELFGYFLLNMLLLLLVALFASTIVAMIFMLIVGADAIQHPSVATEMILELATLPLTVFSMMIGVTMLSVAYREIIGLPEIQNS